MTDFLFDIFETKAKVTLDDRVQDLIDFHRTWEPQIGEEVLIFRHFESNYGGVYFASEMHEMVGQIGTIDGINTYKSQDEFVPTSHSRGPRFDNVGVSSVAPFRISVTTPTRAPIYTWPRECLIPASVPEFLIKRFARAYPLPKEVEPARTSKLPSSF